MNLLDETHTNLWNKITTNVASVKKRKISGAVGNSGIELGIA